MVLQWLDPGNVFCLKGGHTNQITCFRRKGNNQYYILGMVEGCDLNKEQTEQEDCYMPWDQTAWSYFYEQIIEFYKDKRELRCYIKRDDCNSESVNIEYIITVLILLFSLSATPFVPSFVQKAASYGLRSVFLDVGGVFHTESSASLQFKLTAMVQKAASCGSRFNIWILHSLYDILVPSW